MQLKNISRNPMIVEPFGPADANGDPVAAKKRMPGEEFRIEDRLGAEVLKKWPKHFAQVNPAPAAPSTPPKGGDDDKGGDQGKGGKKTQ